MPRADVDAAQQVVARSASSRTSRWPPWPSVDVRMRVRGGQNVGENLDNGSSKARIAGEAVQERHGIGGRALKGKGTVTKTASAQADRTAPRIYQPAAYEGAPIIAVAIQSHSRVCVRFTTNFHRIVSVA